MAVSRTSAADHAAHDQLVLAALVSGDDLPATERATADALVRDCPDCAALVADLRILRSATAALPAPPRRRDFRLTDADAARLRPAGWRRLVAGFASARLAFTAPLGAGLVAIGIVAGFVTLVPGAGGSFATSVALDTSLPRAAAASGPAAAGSVAAPAMALPAVGAADAGASGPETSVVLASGAAAPRPASPPAAGAGGAPAQGPVSTPAAGDRAVQPSDSAAKLPGNAAVLAPPPGASASPGGPAALVPAPDASAPATSPAAMALPVPEPSSPSDVALSRPQSPPGAPSSGVAEAMVPGTEPAATAPTSPDGGGQASRPSLLSIAALVLMALGVLLLALRFAAVRVTSR